MKKTLSLCLLLACTLGLNAQRLSLRHEVQFPFVVNSQGEVGSSDCWGWTGPDGVDYAIMGNSDHVAFVRASDGQVLDSVKVSQNSDAYYHRDFKTLGHYCYAVCEMTGRREGLVVIDLQYLPDSVHFVGAFDATATMIRSHNISVDTARQYAYCESDEQISASGVEIFNLSNPESPVKEGFVSVPNTHDMYGRNDTLWVAEGFTKGYSVYDVTDKGNPVLMGRVTDPQFGYCHNIWPSDDGKFFFTTEETPGKTIKVWDATDMQNIVERGHYIAANQLAHNVHVQGDLLFVSHYTAGITVVDWSDPDAPVEIARFDTYLANDNSGFHGCWGTFPFTANGFIYASNFDGRLFILDWDRNAVNIETSQPRLQGKCWPNPFVQTTNIPLRLSTAEAVSVTVHDLDGKRLATLLEGELAAGSHTLPWHVDGSLPAGTYLVRIAIGETVRTERVAHLGL